MYDDIYNEEYFNMMSDNPIVDYKLIAKKKKEELAALKEIAKNERANNKKPRKAYTRKNMTLPNVDEIEFASNDLPADIYRYSPSKKLAKMRQHHKFSIVTQQKLHKYQVEKHARCDKCGRLVTDPRQYANMKEIGGKRICLGCYYKYYK